MNFPGHQMWDYCVYLGEYKKLDLGMYFPEDYRTPSDATVCGPEDNEYHSGEFYQDSFGGTLYMSIFNKHRRECFYRALAFGYLRHID